VSSGCLDRELEGLLGPVLSAARIRELAGTLHEIRSCGLPHPGEESQ
jgi:hypothetical protein